MISITHKNQLFLLSLFLLLPATMHCMKRSYSDMAHYDNSDQITKEIKSKTIKDLQKTQLRLHNKIKYNANNAMITPSVKITSWAIHSFFQNQYSIIIACFNNNPLLEKYKTDKIDECSLLGPATMTVYDESCSQKTSYHDKKVFIQKLLDRGIKPTPRDKELALVEQWQRWLPLIKRIGIFRYADFLQEIPKDVIQYIEQCMLSTEQPLF